MTPTTLLGTIGKWSGLLAGVLAVVATQAPQGHTTTYLGTGAGLLTAIAHWANGEGNRQSQTGSPQS